MTKDELKELLYQRYITPTEKKRELYAGIEFELPIVNLNRKAVDFNVVHSLTAEFLKNFSFSPTGIDEDGNIYSAENAENGDIFSYDCSYNNLELSFGKEKNLNEIYARFLKYYSFTQTYLKQFNYTLTGMGINPNRKINNNLPIKNGRYKMLYNHLLSFEKYSNELMYFHKHPDFGMFSSASQVQLDVSLEKLPTVIDTFNKLEPVKALLFSNSVLLGENEDILCSRDMLWENSTHGINPHNVGMYKSDIKNIDDILNYLLTTSIYCTERNGKYINFYPVNILEFFNCDKITGEYAENGEIKTLEFSPELKDIEYLRAFKFEDLTYRGTVEFRSACCQPVSDVMTVSAFHLGLIGRINELKSLIDNDNSIYQNGYNAAELRKMLVRKKLPEFIDCGRLYCFVTKILDLCKNGLIERGFGEEKFLAPLYKRAEERTNPASRMLSMLEKGKTIEQVIKEYSRI